MVHERVASIFHPQCNDSIYKRLFEIKFISAHGYLITRQSVFFIRERIKRGDGFKFRTIQGVR